MKLRTITLALVLAMGFEAVAQSVPHTTAATKIYPTDVLPYVEDMGKMSDGYVLVGDSKSKLYAVFTSTGDVVIPFSIPLVRSGRSIPKFYNGVIPAKLTQNNKSFFAVLNTRGEMVKQLKDVTELGENFVDGYVPAFKAIPLSATRRKVVLRYYDTTGKEVLPNLWQDVTGTIGMLQEMRPFCDGLSCYYDYKTRRYGYFDKTGKIVVAAKYAKAHDFSEGLAWVSEDGTQWYFIDTEGKPCSQVFSVEEPVDFHEGVAIVYKRGTSRNEPCYIDAACNVVCGPLYAASRFFGGYAWVTVLNNGTHDYVIDRSFKAVKELPRLAPHNADNTIYDEAAGNVQVGENVYAPDGTCLFDANRWIIKKFSDGLAAFKTDNTVGYLNKQGEVVFMIKLSDF